MRAKIERLWAAAAQHSVLVDRADVAQLPMHVASLLLHHMQSVSKSVASAAGPSKLQVAQPAATPLAVPTAPSAPGQAAAMCAIAAHMGSASGAEASAGEALRSFTTSASSPHARLDLEAVARGGSSSAEADEAALERSAEVLADRVEALAAGGLAQAYADVAASPLCAQPLAEAQSQWAAAVRKLEERGQVRAGDGGGRWGGDREEAEEMGRKGRRGGFQPGSSPH
jgi:hypothetical protein